MNYAAISRAFGTPKPTLANSYEPELLNLRTFPTLMGYSSRIMAESWESNTLYWAALADEIGVPPAQLNLRIPEWTAEAGGAHLRLAPGGLAGGAASRCAWWVTMCGRARARPPPARNPASRNS